MSIFEKSRPRRSRPLVAVYDNNLLMEPSPHYQHSMLRERIIEHVFVGDALRELWRASVMDVEVLRSEFDAYGYDLVMSRGPITRHIQLKAGTTPKPIKIAIQSALSDKPSGCVLWIHVSDRLEMGPYYWLGGSPGEWLPDLAGLPQAKGRRDKTGQRLSRPNHLAVPGARFELIETLSEVLVKLFGPLQGAHA